MLRWLIGNEVRGLTREAIDSLWKAIVISDFASNAEKACLDRCIEYLWQLLEFTEDSEVVKEVTKKLIKRGTDYDLDGSRHRRFLATCYGQMDVMRRHVYIIRVYSGSTARDLVCNLLLVLKFGSNNRIKSLHVVEPSVSGRDWLSSSENEPIATSGPSQMSLKALIQGIVRLLQLISTYIEAGDEHYKVARNFPSHGSLIPGRSLRVYYNIENELRDTAVSPPFIRTNSQETIGQFRSRIANRLHFWKTLEQVGLVSPDEGVFIFEDIRILIRVNRSG
uniref:RICTOR_N domain-containing protein n=1 Tax=Heterorhabditis bacteriophora TaxID=37862 RepID=A0A1I7WJT0_HETBA